MSIDIYKVSQNIITMHSYSLPVFLAFVCLGVISCGTKKPMFDPNDMKSDYISFGSGGGFTGKVSSYFLNTQGDIFAPSDTTFIKVTSISEEMVEQVFANYTALGLDKMILNDPGNKYYFIERNIKGEKQILKWGNNPLDNKNIATYFDILMKPLKDKTTQTK
jgi:hypothetical protein